MATSPKLGLTQTQRFSLTPSMRNALGLLRMSTDQLNDELIREAADNPFLDLVPRPFGPAYDTAAEIAAGQDSLAVSLARQINLQRLSPEVRAAAFHLISQLREDGLLDATLAELARGSAFSPDILEQALTALHRCEPAGVGARDLAECLQLQLIDKGYGAALARQIVSHLPAFGRGRNGQLAQTLALPATEIARIGQHVRSLTATPVSQGPTAIVPRIPELLVERLPDGQLAVTMNPEALPRIAVQDYGGRAVDSPDLRRCLDRARSLVHSMTARGLTLMRIGKHIVDTQSGFFLESPPTLRPESRADAARVLNMHASTLGRALAGKSLAFGGKAHALSQFFSRRVPASSGDISAHDMQSRIRALILAEDRRFPLADEAICAHFRKEGVDISRRTVAKYRKCMRIPTSFERRRRSLSEPGGKHAKVK